MAQETSRDDSSSDTDSVSLLCGLEARCTRGGVAGETGLAELDSVNAPESTSLACEETSNSPLKSGIKATQHLGNPPEAPLITRDGSGETLLLEACERDNLAQVMALLQAGINVNIQDYAGWTALHKASTGGDPELVRELLKAGANVHARRNGGFTPLHDAAQSGHDQVVKLLLQHGSYLGAKTLMGLSAMDLAKKKNIKMLLQASLLKEQSCDAQNRQAEFHGAAQLPIRFRHSRIEEANAKRESGDRDGATKANDSQLKRKETADTHDLSLPKAIKVLLEEAKRRQAKIALWPLAGPGDADKLHAALRQIQNVLIEALAKQQLAKHAVARKFRNVPIHFQQRVLKSEIVSLASRQRTLLKMVQEHSDLVTKYINMKKKSSTSNTMLDAGGVKDVKEFAASTQSLNVRTRTDNDVPCKNSQSSVLLTGQSSQHTDFEENHRGLSELMVAGVLNRRTSLKLNLKGQLHIAHLVSKGFIKDSKGKLFPTPTDWFRSVLGSSTPVSSAHVWDQVTCKGRPLSYYLLNTEAAGNTAQTCTEDAAPHCEARCSQEEEVTEAAALKHVMKIRIIHLVNDEELMPISVLDQHWERALSQDW